MGVNPTLLLLSAAVAFSLVAPAADLLNTAGSLTAADATESGRLTRTGATSDWSTSKAFPDTTAGTYHYKTFTVNPGNARYIQVDFDDPSVAFLASAYLDSYNPASPATNYLGDLASSGDTAKPGDPAFFQVVVPAGHNVVIVVNELTSGGGIGPVFGLLVEGFADTLYTYPGPPPPVLIAPANGATSVSSTPTLTWNASPGATSYDVYLGAANPPTLVANVAGTSYAPAALPNGTTLFWKIVAKNTLGTGSSIWSFTTMAINAPDLVVSLLTAPNTATPFGQFNVSVTVANQGNVAVGAFRVEYYFSATSTISASSLDTGWGCNFVRLGVGVSATCTGPIIVPRSLGPGTWYFGAIVDPSNQVVELNEANNSRAADSGPIILAAGPISKIGVFRNGLWALNFNGDENSLSASNHYYNFGQAGDILIEGDWNGDGTTKIGIFRNGLWVLNYNGDGNSASPSNRYYNFGISGDVPVVGDWNGDGKTKIGVYRNGQWVLDYTGDGNGFSPNNRYFSFGGGGDKPVLGDWNGDGKTKVGIYRNGLWALNYNGDEDATSASNRFYNFGQVADVPVVGDWNGNGRAKVGIFRNGLWALNLNGDGDPLSVSNQYFWFGIPGDVPVVGDWNGDTTSKAGIYRNGLWVLNYTGDGNGFSPNNRNFVFGIPEDKPVIGAWSLP